MAARAVTARRSRKRPLPVRRKKAGVLRLRSRLSGADRADATYAAEATEPRTTTAGSARRCERPRSER